MNAGFFSNLLGLAGPAVTGTEARRPLEYMDKGGSPQLLPGDGVGVYKDIRDGSRG